LTVVSVLVHLWRIRAARHPTDPHRDLDLASYGVVAVLEHGSHTQTTAARLAATFSTSGGSTRRIRRVPIRVVRVSRPGS